MNELGNGENDVEEDLDEDIETDEDAVADIGDGDGASDMTGEVNVEALVAKLDATPKDDVEQQRKVHKRLSELREQQDAAKEIDSTYNFNLDDEL